VWKRRPAEAGIPDDKRMLAYLWVAVGGALGSVGRFWLNGVVSAQIDTPFPWGTMLVNISGSFLIGIIGAVAGAEGRLDSASRVFVTNFLMVGICGGYTTFSSFSLQTLKLLQDRQWLYAGGNILLSMLLCMIAVWLGYLLGATINSIKGT
jgi:CrcB protein